MYKLAPSVQTYFGTPAGAAGIRGLGCGCGCGGRCSDGMGLFDSGLDPTGWGWPEWGIVALGVYAAFSIMFTTASGTRAAREGVRRRVRRTRRRIGSKIAGKEL